MTRNRIIGWEKKMMNRGLLRSKGPAQKAGFFMQIHQVSPDFYQNYFY